MRRTVKELVGISATFHYQEIRYSSLIYITCNSYHENKFYHEFNDYIIYLLCIKVFFLCFQVSLPSLRIEKGSQSMLRCIYILFIIVMSFVLKQMYNKETYLYRLSDHIKLGEMQ